MSTPQYRVQIRRDPRHIKQNLFVETKAKRKIVRAGRRFGKTVSAGRIAVERFLLGRRPLYAAPTTEQTDKFWNEVCWSLEEPLKYGLLKKNETERTIEHLTNKHNRIKAKTAWNANTMRGDYTDDLILDEFQLMAEEVWEVVAQPMLLDNNGDAVFIYTPPSLHTRSVSKAVDPKYASRMFKRAQEEMRRAAEEGRESRWFALAGTSFDNPTISREALDEISKDMSSLAYRQEILAEENEDAPGALWNRLLIEKLRTDRVRSQVRVVIGVDPSGGATECGIVAACTAMCECKGKPELHGFVLEDASKRCSAGEWAGIVNVTYNMRKADLVVGEQNFGGDMVETVIKTANPNIRYKHVNASRGKERRAEPVLALYEQGRVHHVGAFPALEDEMCQWIPGISSFSPNRMDAKVWALTELMVGRKELYF